MTELRLRARLGPNHAIPDPERKRAGNRSIVTIFEVVGGQEGGFPPGLVARYFDEWGQIDSMPVAWLIVDEEPTVPQPPFGPNEIDGIPDPRA